MDSHKRKEKTVSDETEIEMRYIKKGKESYLSSADVIKLLIQLDKVEVAGKLMEHVNTL